MLESDEKTSPVRRLLSAGRRARKWLLGLVLAGVAAALTAYITGSVSSAIDAARGLFEDEPPPVAVTMDRAVRGSRVPPVGSVHFVFKNRPIKTLRRSRVPNPGDAKMWDEWARRNRGVGSNATAVELIVEGLAPHPVRLTNIEIEMVRRAPPPRGVSVHPHPGSIGRHDFAVNLDESRPTVRAVRRKKNEPAVDFPYTVSQSRAEFWLLVARTRSCDCSWLLVVHWLYQGEKGIIRLDDEGDTPFRTCRRLGQRFTTHGRDA
jgi:hypothetical protein